MTARGLHRSLGLESLEVEQLEKLLLAASIRPNRIIRYSVYPSKKTLDVLWGHIDIVGERSLPNLTLDPGGEAWQSRLRSENNVFLSHSHKDAALTIQVADKLGKAEVGCWLAESEISPSDYIHQIIQKGIDQCEGLILLLTENSVHSTWVEKEFGVVGGLGKPCFVVCTPEFLRDRQDLPYALEVHLTEHPIYLASNAPKNFELREGWSAKDLGELASQVVFKKQQQDGNV